MKKNLLLFITATVLFSHVVIAKPFSDNGDGTITDHSTHLIWQKREPGEKNWQSAMAYCRGLTLGGKKDWRLPSQKELRSVIDQQKFNPLIDEARFPDAKASVYWTSTTYAIGSSGAWTVVFVNGGVDYYGAKNSHYYVRCVRGELKSN